MKEQKDKRVTTRIRIIYKPLAGRCQTLTRAIDQTGMVLINGGKHTITEESLFPWKGKLPWCRIHQGTIPALPNFGEPKGPSPEWLNVIVSNHYAADTMGALESYAKDNSTQLYLMVAMVGLVIIIQLILGIWTMNNLSDLAKHIAQLTPQALPTSGDTTVVHHA
jgi:hypothetical protein